MTNPYRPNNILAMNVFPRGVSGEIDVLTVFKDGTLPRYFEGVGDRTEIAKGLVRAFQVGVPRTRHFLLSARGDYKVVSPDWQDALEQALLLKVLIKLQEEEEEPEEEEDSDPEEEAQPDNFESVNSTYLGFDPSAFGFEAETGARAGAGINTRLTDDVFSPFAGYF